MSLPDVSSIPCELDAVTSQLDDKIERLAQGSAGIESAALRAAKYIFDLSLETERSSKTSIDELLASLNPLQKPQTRSQGSVTIPPTEPSLKYFEPTPISSLLIDNMDTDQVWMQLDLRAQMMCDLLDFALETGRNEDISGEEDEETEDDDGLREVMEAIENGEGIDADELESLGEHSGMESDDHDESDGGEDEASDIAAGEEDIVRLRFSDEEQHTERRPTLLDVVKPSSHSKKRKNAEHGLNDNFFDLDMFHAETEFAEAKSSSGGRLAEDSDDSEDETTSVDLFTAVDDIDEEADGTTEIFYRDFFEPPRSTKSGSNSTTPNCGQGRVRFHDEVRVKKIKAKGKNLPLSLLYGVGDEGDDQEEEDNLDREDLEEDFDEEGDAGLKPDSELSDEDQDPSVDVNWSLDGSDENMSQDSGSEAGDDKAAMERLKDDLFAEDYNTSPNNDTTTHERRQAALRDQIAQLESENVTKKEWTLMGEADSRSRPQNSLLEEDLEFERVMKAVPVISEELVQDLEQRIKARIQENRFDDVVRIRPVEDKPFLPSRIIELQDTRSTQSLAQIYEKDYLANQSNVVDDRDGKLKQEHEQIEQQWERICSKLDALCNAHFVPKQPKAVISTVSNVATASTESALPTVKATSSILAPEEIFAPALGEARSRSELTPAEKRVLRTKERKSRKKQREILEKTVNKVAKVSKGFGGAKREKRAALQNIVKSGKGVTVVGKHARGLTPPKKRQKL